MQSLDKKTTHFQPSSQIEIINLPSEALHDKILLQSNNTAKSGKILLQKITQHIHVLTIKKDQNTTPILVKKFSDIAQYANLPSHHNQEKFYRISLAQLKNQCLGLPPALWFTHEKGERAIYQKVHLIFFYNLERLKEDFLTAIKKEGLFYIDPTEADQLVVSDGQFLYRLSLMRFVSNTVWQSQSLEQSILIEIEHIKLMFKYFQKLLVALKNSYQNVEWHLDMGRLAYNERGVSRTVNYQNLTDDIFHVKMAHQPEKFLTAFKAEELNCEPWYPTVSIRSLLHLKARPDGVFVSKTGYALVASKEHLGKQTPVSTREREGAKTLHLWLRRSNRYLASHSYRARAIIGPNREIDCIALVGDQIASLALHPELIKGALESLNISFSSNVRLISHNEDALTIATMSAPWASINEMSHRSSQYLRILPRDGSDPITLFEQVKLPEFGGGFFQIQFIPAHFFRLIDTATDKSKTLPAGHNYYLLGLAYECIHEWEQSIEHFKKALSKDAGDADILAALGNNLMELNRFDEARTFLARAVSLAPGDAELTHTLGQAHMACGDLEAALAPLEKAVQLCPSSDNYLTSLGQAYWESRRAEDALTVLTMALRCNPQHAGTHSLLAEIYQSLGQLDLAKKHALLAFNANPSDTNIANILWGLTVKKDANPEK
jgi:tetratricopeptide (TPR) repeat protein